MSLLSVLVLLHAAILLPGHCMPIAYEMAPTRFAYVSMLAYPSTPERRDYLISFLVATESIRRTGSTHDVVAMVYGLLSVEDEELLGAEGVKVVRVASVASGLESNPEAFDEQSAAVYRAKTRVLELVEYEMVLFFDSDVIFHKNCDDLFASDKTFIGRMGSNSPYYAGLYLIRPSLRVMADIEAIASSGRFNLSTGWMGYGPIPDWRISSSEAGSSNNNNNKTTTTDWSFYGASVEQGLFFYYYMCKKAGGGAELLPMYAWDDRATHFTGSNKPFASQQKKTAVATQRFGSAQSQWLELHGDLQARLKWRQTLVTSSFSESAILSTEEDLVSHKMITRRVLSLLDRM